MGNTFSSRILILLLLAMFCGLSQSSYAQKKKKKFDVAPGNKVTREYDIAEAEYLFVEGEKYFLLEEYSKAIQFFEKSREINPENGTVNFKIAECHVDMGQITEALPYAVRAVQLDSANKYFYILAAEIHTNLSNFSAAADLYERMLRNVPGTETYLFELGATYLYQGNTTKALETYERAKDYFGINEDITFQKQKIYINQNDFPGAIREAEELIAAYPDEPRYVFNLVELLMNQGRSIEAVPYLEELLEQDPTNSQASVYLSEAYRKNGEFEKSIGILKTAFANPQLDVNAKIQMLGGYIALLPNEKLESLLVGLSDELVATHPNVANAHTIAGDLHFQLQQKEEALYHYKTAISLDDANFSIWQNILSLELELGEYDSLIAYSNKALELFPNQAVLYYFNGTANLVQKNYKQAINVLSTGKKYARNDPNLSSFFNGQLGDAYNAIEEHDKSDEAYEEALVTKPDNDHVLNNYSYFLSLRKEKLDQALEMSTKLVERNPETSTYLDTHAWVLYMMEKYEEAREFLERAVEDENASGTIHEHYGDVLFQLGEVDRAVEQWTKARDLNDATDLIDKKIADRKLYE